MRTTLSPSMNTLSGDIDQHDGDNDVKISWKPLLAGYTAGCCGLIVGHPLDSLKVLLQNSTDGASNNAFRAASSPELSRTAPVMGLRRPAIGAVMSMQRRTLLTSDSAAYAVARKYMDSAPAISSSSTSSAIGKRSIRSLYAGISAPLVTVGLVQSLNFALYDSFRRILHQRDLENCEHSTYHHTTSYRDNDSLFNICTSAFASGSLVSVVTSPLVILKTKQQLMLWSLRKAIKDTMKQPGGIIRNFYAGYGIHLFCDSVGRSIFFVSYECLKKTIQQMKTRAGQENTATSSVPPITVVERMASACMAGMISWGFIFPFDVIRSKTYAHTVLSPSQPIPSSFAMARRIWEADGRKSFRPFFRGFGVTVARAGPVAAVALPVYDLALNWLSDFE